MAWGNALKGAAGGAGTGAMFGPWGAAIGGVIGGISGALSPSNDDILGQRKSELQKKIRDIYDQRLQTGMSEIRKTVSGNLAMNKTAASRRALSLGKSGDAESFVLPGQSQITNQGAQATRQFATSNENARADANLAAEGAWAGRQIEPNVSDFLFGIGQSAFSHKQNQNLLDGMTTTQKESLAGDNASTIPNYQTGGYTVPDGGQDAYLKMIRDFQKKAK